METTLSTRGGRTVGQQLAHVIWNRNQKIQLADKEAFSKLPDIQREHGHDRGMLRKGFELTAAAIADIIRNSAGNDGKVKGFKRGIVPLVGYLIAHDAHHRGHILLTLKQAGVKFNANTKMMLWAWNRI